MTLDMNHIRNAFAAKITANDGDKGSMDAALFHVVKIAFEQGRTAGGAGEREAPYTCQYCGRPSWLEPIDQTPPADYCHESDHGSADEE